MLQSAGFESRRLRPPARCTPRTGWAEHPERVPPPRLPGLSGQLDQALTLGPGHPYTSSSIRTLPGCGAVPPGLNAERRGGRPLQLPCDLLAVHAVASRRRGGRSLPGTPGRIPPGRDTVVPGCFLPGEPPVFRRIHRALGARAGSHPGQAVLTASLECACQNGQSGRLRSHGGKWDILAGAMLRGGQRPVH